MPCSEVSGVRSSCDAVATNARRAASWRRSSRCIAGQRARELADLVEAVVARRGRVGALLGHAVGGVAQPRQPAAEGGGEGDAEQEGDGEPDGGGGQERLAHLVEGGDDVGQLLLGGEDEEVVGRGVAARRRHVHHAGDGDRVADPDGLADPVDRRAQDVVLGDRAAGEVGVGDRRSPGIESVTITRAFVRRRSCEARSLRSTRRRLSRSSRDAPREARRLAAIALWKPRVSASVALSRSVDA